jgi:hypothetical protein
LIIGNSLVNEVYNLFEKEDCSILWFYELETDNFIYYLSNLIITELFIFY